MKKIIPFLFCASLSAAPFIPLPETIAWVDGKAVPASKISVAWKNTLNALPENVSPESIRRLFASLAAQAVWQREIAAMLAEEKIPVSRETACRYFEDQFKQYPAYFSQQKQKQFLASAAAPDIMLKAAIHYYLKKMAPEKIRVSRSEVENYYRLHQNEFKIFEKLQLGPIQTKTKKEAEMARAYLLQGGDFRSAYQRFSTKEKNIRIPENLRFEKMKTKEITPVIPMDHGFLVIQIIQQAQTSFRSLSEVSPEIALLLAARKEARVLTILLNDRLKEKKIIYAQLVL